MYDYVKDSEKKKRFGKKEDSESKEIRKQGGFRNDGDSAQRGFGKKQEDSVEKRRIRKKTEDSGEKEELGFEGIQIS